MNTVSLAILFLWFNYCWLRSLIRKVFFLFTTGIYHFEIQEIWKANQCKRVVLMNRQSRSLLRKVSFPLSICIYTCRKLESKPVHRLPCLQQKVLNREIANQLKIGSAVQTFSCWFLFKIFNCSVCFAFTSRIKFGGRRG